MSWNTSGNGNGNRWADEDNVRFFLCMILGTMIASIIVLLMFVEVPDKNRDIVIAATGALLTSFTGLVAFYAKTGIATDRKKDETISKQADALKTQADVTKNDQSQQ